MSWALIGRVFLSALQFIARNWKWFAIAGLAVALHFARANARHWEGVARSITVAIGDASGNPKLRVGDAAHQAMLLGQSRDAWKAASQKQTAAVNSMVASVKLLAGVAEQRRKEIAANVAVRDAVLKRLEDQAITPGDRADCAAQLRAAEDALNTLYDEGF